MVRRCSAITFFSGMTCVVLDLLARKAGDFLFEDDGDVRHGMLPQCAVSPSETHCKLCL